MTKRPLKWITEKSKGQRLNMAVLILSNVVFAFLTVVFAFAVKMVIDGAERQDKSVLINGAIFIGIIILLQFVFRIIINGLLERIKGKLEMAYKSYMFSQILGKKYINITTFHTGELINRLTSDVRIVSESVAEILPIVVGSTTRLVCAIIALLIIDPIFAVAFVVAGLSVCVVMALLRKRLKSLHKKAQQTDGKTRSFMQESFENILMIKASSTQKDVLEKTNGLQEENFKVKMKRKNYSVFGHATYNFIFSVGYVFALVLGGFRMLLGPLGFGDLTAILQLVNSVQVPFASLSNVAPRYFAMLASAERLMEIENLPNESGKVCDNPNELYESLNTISAKGLTFAYEEEQILKDASFSIQKGQSVALVGTSGAGKSTLMKLLLGIYDFEGQLELEYNDCSIAISEYTRPLFSYVPQGNMLFAGTIKENLTFMNPNADDEDIQKALKVACANEFVDNLPLKVQTLVGEGGLGLSEGQIQRLAIARAVLHDAPILLLDEATSALDKNTEYGVLQNLLALENKTIILISHRKEASALCSRILNLSNKKVAEKTI